ncbi:TetR/AcrR family transcriptional regulator [Actinoplanes sp. RD1]|uniref:TetR/AcrR family transcriptional regulator n=1 Tax=Actinoplanes sp. RD1 TaxID=3064538 RepID=UPI00274259CA|nr:helix-turn-helix domain-containing protein [Actinoplanes sp. RD1]
MARWQSGARERLQQAAMSLFVEHGFEGVTVAQIAAAAGLTERTFFRHFADKREVLFPGHDEFERAFLTALGETPDGETPDGEAPDGETPDGEAPDGDPMALVTAALAGAGDFFPEERRTWSRTRNAILRTHPGFLERELLKMSSLAAALTRALEDRGADPIAAALAAETGVTVFRTAFTTWIAEGETRTLPEIQEEVLARLHGLLATRR